MTIWHYALGSTLLTAVVTTQALAVYPNYFAALTAISANSASLLVFANQFLLLLWLLAKGILSIAFGELRLAETEKIYQRAWPLVIDGVMLATSLQSTGTGLSLGVLLSLIGFLLVLHWVLDERAPVLYQMMEFPTPSRQLRIFSLALILAKVDVDFFMYAWDQIIRGNALYLLMFPFFIDLLSMACISICCLLFDFLETYVFAGDLEDGEEWERKPLLLFITGFTIHSVSMVLYVFSVYLAGNISFHLFFGVLSKARTIYTLVTEFYRASQAKRLLNSLVEDASPDDIGRDNLCVICREEMSVDASDRMKPKRMNCGHVIHFACLKSWMNRVQHCPTCRQPVKQTKSAFGQTQNQTQMSEHQRAGTPAGDVDELDAQQGPLATPVRPPSARDAQDTTGWHTFATRTNDQTLQINIGDAWYDLQVI